MAKAPDYGSYIPDANDPVYVTQAQAAKLGKELPLYASGQGTPIFNNPGGIDGYVQFNSASSFGGDVGFTYNSKTRSVNILGNLNVGGYLNSKFFTNFANLKITGGNDGDIMFTDGLGNLSWGNLADYVNTETLALQLDQFQQGNVNFTGGNVSLGQVSNLHILGGSPNYILSTDGFGNLTWIEETGGGPDRISIHNGTSNVSVPDINGNVYINVNGTYQWVYKTNGELLAGGQFVAKQGELTAGSGYTFNETGRDTGMYSDNDGHLKFKTNNKLSAYYTDNDVHLYTKSADYITTYDWHFDREGNLTLPVGGHINYSNGVSILSGLGGGGGISIGDFGEGFSLTASNKIVTNKLYSTNGTNPNQHYRLTLDTNGVVHLPDESIINGATLRVVPGTGELNYAALAAGPDDSHPEKTWIWADSTGAWIQTNSYTSDIKWHFDNDGHMLFPAGSDHYDLSAGGGILSHVMEVNSNAWEFDSTGNLTVPGNVIQGDSRFSLNEGNAGAVYLTPVTNDSTALYMTSQGDVQLYGNAAVSLYAGSSINTLLSAYNSSLSTLTVAFEAQSGEVGYPWGITLPISFNTYNELSALPAETIPNQTTITELANTCNTAYYAYQSGLQNDKVFLRTPSNEWSFGEDGSFSLPGDNEGPYQLDPAKTTSISLPNTNPTVVFNSLSPNVEGIKAIIKVLAPQPIVGDTQATDTQMCEMIISIKYSYLTVPPYTNSKSAVASIYGVTHTSNTPLATFDVRVMREPVTNIDRVQILATPAAGAEGDWIYVQVVATELVNND